MDYSLIGSSMFRFFTNFGNLFCSLVMRIQDVRDMVVKLLVDGKDIPINDFVESILSGTIVGAVTTLHGVSEEWKKIEIKVERQASH